MEKDEEPNRTHYQEIGIHASIPEKKPEMIEMNVKRMSETPKHLSEKPKHLSERAAIPEIYDVEVMEKLSEGSLHLSNKLKSLRQFWRSLQRKMEQVICCFEETES